MYQLLIKRDGGTGPMISQQRSFFKKKRATSSKQDA